MAESISIIIPALNEAEAIGRTLDSVEDSVRDSAGDSAAEWIVVDGDSEDRTAEIARARGATVVTAPRGRASQMNAGAKIARGETLLFLHADTRLPQGFAEEVRRVLGVPGVAAGAFSLRIDGAAKGMPRGMQCWMQFVERAANWRSRILQLPYGDQGFFLKAEVFRSLGGFPELPLMEDLEMARRVRGHGRIAISPLGVVTSARRWERVGVVRATLLNQVFLLAYLAGMPPRRIAQWYYPRSKLQTANSKLQTNPNPQSQNSK